MFRRTSDDSSVRRYNPISIHEDELEAYQVKDTIAKEKSSEEYKENGRSTTRDEDHLEHEK